MKKQIEYLQRLFYDIWNDFGSVYLLVKHSGRTTIGKRGFTEEEKQRGLVLVFNNKTNTKLEWDGEGNVSCVLAFGERKEDVSIYHDDLIGLFSPEAGIQFVRSDAGKASEPAVPLEKKPRDEDNHIISLNSYRKKKSGE